MDSEDIGPRDLENLRVPAIARVGRDEAQQAAERSAASSDASAQPTTPNEPEVSSPLPAQRQEHSIHTRASRT